LLLALVGIILTILLVVGIHEFGHFLAARLLGIKVLRFSIGFGKALVRWHDKKGTEYVIAAIPLGGYVKILNEEEDKVAEEELHLAFNRQPFYKKFLVVIAGPLFNLILAFFLYWSLFVIGFTSIVPVVGKVMPHSIAEEAGIKPQQEILKIDDKPTTSWMAVVIRILARTGETGQLRIETRKFDTQQNPRTHLLDLTHWRMDELKPDPLGSLGVVPYEPKLPAIIGTIHPDTPAAKTNLKIGDKIIAVNNKPIAHWHALIEIIDAHPTQKLSFTIRRDNTLHTISVTTDYQRDMLFRKHGFLGISPQFHWPENFLYKNKYGPIAALSHAWQSTSDFIGLNFMVIGKLLQGKISLHSLGGPISIFQGAGAAFHQGIIPFLNFLAFLSIAIGIINILPIPGLDGGHILFQVIEAITRRPLSPRVLALCYRLGIILLFLLVFQAIINDILRLYR